MKTIGYLALTILLVVFWFSGVAEIGFNMDEIPWILDTQYYTFRKEKDWERFQLPEGYTRLRWSDAGQRLIDQPQMGKYLIGSILDLTNSNPWNSSNPSWLYQEFSKNPHGGERLSEIQTYLGGEMFRAINVIRYASATVGLTSLLLFSYAITRLSDKPSIGLLALVLATIHPLLLGNLRLATGSSFSLLFLITSTLLMYWTLSKIHKMKTMETAFASLLLGALIAAATSIKLNGAFLLFFPAFYALVIIGLRQKESLLSSYQTRERFLLFYVLMMISFFVTFLYLEPELWSNPVKGMIYLAGSRLAQQERFYAFYGKTSWIAVPLNTVRLFLSLSTSYLIQAGLIVLLLLGLYELGRMARKKEKNVLLLSLLVYIMVANGYYARIGFHGFDRYLTPSLLVAILVASLGAKRASHFASAFQKRKSEDIKRQKEQKSSRIGGNN